jgi:hypothetical protein
VRRACSPDVVTVTLGVSLTSALALPRSHTVHTVTVVIPRQEPVNVVDVAILWCVATSVTVVVIVVHCPPPALDHDGSCTAL